MSQPSNQQQATNNNNTMMPANNTNIIAKPAHKKRAAKKPRNGLWAFGPALCAADAYGVGTFPASAEAAAAFFAPPPHPLLAAVPRPAPQPKAAE